MQFVIAALYIWYVHYFIQIAVMTVLATSSVLVSVLKPVHVQCSLSLIHVNQVST